MANSHIGRNSTQLSSTVVTVVDNAITSFKALYKNTIRKRQREEKEYYTNELHEALIKKTWLFFLEVLEV